MSFTIRKASINDANELYEMINSFHSEANIRKKEFTNKKEQFIKDVFGDNTTINFFIAEFNDAILGYFGYSFLYHIINGDYLLVKELFVKEDYRNIGVSVFMYSKIIDIAFESKSHSIKWLIDITDKKVVEIEEKAGAVIDKNLLVLNIYKEDLKFYLQNFYKETALEIRLAKTIDLPEIYECIENLSKSINIEMKTDIYKLMKDGFSLHTKYKMFVAVENNEILGFLSFTESYCAFSGKGLITDQIFIKKDKRGKGIAKHLLSELFHFAYKNNYEKVETSISKFKVETIEKLKEYNVYPYENLRVAHYIKEKFKDLYKT